jgi:hypothetical protein
MKSGLLPGAIAGLMGGVTAGTVSVIGHLTGQWGVITGGEIIPTIEFWYNQFGHHAFITLVWGAIYGLLYPKVYNLVPGKKVVKGLYYGAILFFITTVQTDSWVTVWFANHNAWDLAFFSILGIFAYLFGHIIYGIVLGYLYRKPSE